MENNPMELPPGQSDIPTERLTHLFNQHLNISSAEKPHDQPRSPPPKYTPSQHYTHSAHPPRPPLLHPLHPSPNDHTTRLLIQNDIPPASLLRAQLTLFETSTTDQQARLIMLWRLAPPTYARHGGQQAADRAGEYQSVTLEREEELAWGRYARFLAGGEVGTGGLAVGEGERGLGPRAAAAAAAAAASDQLWCRLPGGGDGGG